MEKPTYVIAYDIGTTGNKTCLYNISGKIELVASSMRGYGLNVLSDGGVEQNPNDWWNAMCETTKEVLEKTKISKDEIKGISFCSQMQGLVLVDKNGYALRPAMSYMDQRSVKQRKEGLSHGFQVLGMNAKKLINSLLITGAVAASVKDPIWKYKWVQDNEPDVFSRVHKWLDVKEYLIGRATDRFIMTRDTAFSIFLFDSRKGKMVWSKKLCKLFKINMNHLPEIICSTDKVGGITDKAAAELGLSAGTPVFGGGGDATLIGIGAGSVANGDTHIYSGTSGWVSTVVDKRKLDIDAMIASIVGAQPGLYNYFAEQETSGKCLEWVKEHLALDEINIYFEKKHVAEGDEERKISLYDFMCQSFEMSPAGAGGVIFTPWLHGNRCPFEDPNARGVFFNIGIDTGKRDMIRAVVEGIGYHNRWMLEAQDKNVKTSEKIRFVGGGALSPVICQVIADILQRDIETVDNPQNVGAVGAAVVIGIGLGKISNFAQAKDFIPVKAIYKPRTENKEIYDQHFKVFKNLYPSNKKNFAALNQQK